MQARCTKLRKLAASCSQRISKRRFPSARQRTVRQASSIRIAVSGGHLAFSVSGASDRGAIRPTASPPSFGGSKGRIDETLAFVDRPVVTQRIRQRGEHIAQDFLLTPLLESVMHRLSWDSTTARSAIACRCSKSRARPPRPLVWRWALQESASESTSIDRRAGEACQSLLR